MFSIVSSLLRRAERTVEVISCGFWQRRFGGSPDVIGKKAASAAQPD